MCDKSFMKNMMKFESIQNNLLVLPQINKGLPQMRKIVRNWEKTVETLKEQKLAKTEFWNQPGDCFLLPMSPKLRPRKLRLDLLDTNKSNISQISSESKNSENRKENSDAPVRRSIRIRKLNERISRKRLFSQEAPQRTILYEPKLGERKVNEGKLVIRILNKDLKDKALSANIPNFCPKSPTVESSDEDLKKISKLNRFLKAQF